MYSFHYKFYYLNAQWICNSNSHGNYITLMLSLFYIKESSVNSYYVCHNISHMQSQRDDAKVTALLYGQHPCKVTLFPKRLYTKHILCIKTMETPPRTGCAKSLRHKGGAEIAVVCGIAAGFVERILDLNWLWDPTQCVRLRVCLMFEVTQSVWMEISWKCDKLVYNVEY